MADPPRAVLGGVRVHRGVLQPATTALHARDAQPRRVRGPARRRRAAARAQNLNGMLKGRCGRSRGLSAPATRRQRRQLPGPGHHHRRRPRSPAVPGRTLRRRSQSDRTSRLTQSLGTASSEHARSPYCWLHSETMTLPAPRRNMGELLLRAASATAAISENGRSSRRSPPMIIDTALFRISRLPDRLGSDRARRQRRARAKSRCAAGFGETASS